MGGERSTGCGEGRSGEDEGGRGRRGLGRKERAARAAGCDRERG